MQKLTLRPYSISQKEMPVPALVQLFLAGEFKQISGAFEAEVKTDCRDTKHGMDYLNQLIVKNGDQVIYDSGMLLWRNGRPNTEDSPHLHFRNAAIKIDGEQVLLGMETGTGMIVIDKLENGQRHIVQRFDKAEANRIKESKKLNDLTDLSQLREHFRENKNKVYPYSPWKIGASDFECELGRGFLAYHNGHPTDTVWDYGVVLLVRDDVVYISDNFNIGLSHWGKFTSSTVLKRKVEGNKFVVTFSSGYHKNSDRNPKEVSFQLEIA